MWTISQIRVAINCVLVAQHHDKAGGCPPFKPPFKHEEVLNGAPPGKLRESCLSTGSQLCHRCNPAHFEMLNTPGLDPAIVAFSTAAKARKSTSVGLISLSKLSATYSTSITEG